MNSNPARARGAKARRIAGHVAAAMLVLSLRVESTGPGTAEYAWATRPGVTEFEWSAATVVFNAVAVGVLLARHRMPKVVLSVVVGMVAASVPLGLFNAGIVAAAAIATFTLTLRLTRVQGVALTLAVAAAMSVAASVAGAAVPQNALVVLLGGALGDAIRTQRAYVAAVTERAERAEHTREALARQRVAEDRLGIARDLHDVVAHQIAVINLHAGVASAALRSRPDDAERSLTVIRDSSRTVLSEIGNLLATLRDPRVVDVGPPGLAQLDDVVRDFASHGLDVTVRADGEPHQLPAAVDVTALRVVQEALTNAHKHGAEHRAHVLLEYGPHALRITVANPVPVEATSGEAGRALGTGNGLVGMRERVDSVRGTLSFGPDGVGTWLLAADLPTSPHPTDSTTAEERS